MDHNLLLHNIEEVQLSLWIGKLDRHLADGSLCTWVSSFHPQKATVRFEGDFHNGSYNGGLKMVFNAGGTAWFLRFVLHGKIHPDYADEKVVAEMRAMDVIRERTTIPVPHVHTWGLAAANSLGLGPYIIMDFVEGVPLDRLLRVDSECRIIKDDISADYIEPVYRQFAKFLLQLFKLDFDQIGTLPETGDAVPIPTRPLTWKAHEILNGGGVNTFGDRSKGFASTTEYFRYVVGQDMQQLKHQPNAVLGPTSARKRFRDFKALESIVPSVVNKAYERKYKLICDDLGLANMIVKSKDDLTIVGVIDLEWSYVGPAQMLASGPWWLLQDRPVNPEWDYDDDRTPPAIAPRFVEYLDMFKRVLAEEEAKANAGDEFSQLVQWSQDSGAMWFHMVISAGFNDGKTFPFAKLREHVGEDEWERLCGLEDKDTDAFVGQRVADLEDYEEKLERLEAMRALVENVKMSREDFIAGKVTESTEQALRAIKIEADMEHQAEAESKEERTNEEPSSKTRVPT